MATKGLSLVEVLVASVVLAIAAVLFATTYSTSAGVAWRGRTVQTAHALMSEQAELIRRRVERQDPSPWNGPSGRFHALFAAPYRSWVLRLDTKRERYDVRRAGTVHTNPWFLLNEANMGSASESAALKQQRLKRIADQGLDLIVRVAALVVQDPDGTQRPAPPGAPATTEPRDALIWQVDVLRNGARAATTQFVTWAPVHGRAGEPR